MNRKNAFSITEVMIAVLIIAACLAPIFFVFSKGAAGTQQTRDEVLAYNHATELLDFALSKPFDSSFLSVGDKRDANVIEVTPTTGEAFTLKIDERFHRTLSVVAPTTPTSVPYAYKVLVAEVSWNTANVKRHISMTGLVHRTR